MHTLAKAAPVWVFGRHRNGLDGAQERLELPDGLAFGWACRIGLDFCLASILATFTLVLRLWGTWARRDAVRRKRPRCAVGHRRRTMNLIYDLQYKITTPFGKVMFITQTANYGMTVKKSGERQE